MDKLEEIKKYVRSEFEKSGQKWFVDLHIKSVENLAMKLVKIKNANEEIVKLAVWLHDIYYIDSKPSVTDENDNHDIIGSKEARKILKKYDYDEKIITGVEECILSHRCRDKKPKTLESKIIATADAMNHIENFSMLLFVGFVKNKMNIKQVYEWLSRKIEHDWNDKILFSEAKDMIKEKYDDVKSILNAMKVDSQ